MVQLMSKMTLEVQSHPAKEEGYVAEDVRSDYAQNFYDTR
jgi:hypothetical protein